MTPRTRSGGAAPPPSIVYKSTPTLKQVQFPARRRRVRTYGKRNRKSGGGGGNDDNKENEGDSSTHPTPNLKQKTLTQYDFSSSFREESVVELSDASDVENLEKVDDTDEAEAEKENNVPKGTKRRRSPTAKPTPLQPIDLTEKDEEEEGAAEEEELRVPDTEAEEEEEEEEDEGPVVRGRRGAVGFVDAGKAKRRRTLGDEHRMSTMKESKSRSSRRRTLGDSPIAGPSRRRPRYHTQTLTQFIGRTASCVADSDDDDEGALGGGAADNDDFLEWLGGEDDDAGPQSPTMGTQASKRNAAAAATQVWEDEHSPSPRPRTRTRPPPATQTSQQQQQPREESVVPQTPIRSIRFSLPPSAQHVSLSPARMAAIYGAPDQYASPSQRQRQKSSPAKPLLALTGKPRRRSGGGGGGGGGVSPVKKPELVIADSYATEGWSSVGGTQARHGGTPSQMTQTQVYSTPAEESAAAAAAGPAATATATTSASTQASKVAENDEEEEEAAEAAPLHTQSQDGQVVEEQFYGALSQIVQDSAAASQQPSPVTPLKRATQSQPPAEEAVAATAAAAKEREIPDSDEEDEESDLGAQSDASTDEEESRFAAGAETQLLMDQLQSSVRKWSGGAPSRAGGLHAASSSSVASPRPRRRTSSPVAPSPASATTPPSAPPSSSSLKPAAPAPATTSKQPPKKQPRPRTVTNDIPIAQDPHSTPLRTPLHHPAPIDTQGLPLESQRVAVATLHAFPPASARTDILLPLSGGTLSALLAGRQDVVVLPFKVPAQVVRFWLLHDGVLRYLACLAAGGGGAVHDQERDNGCGGRGTWSYRAAQVYELNNPAREDDMRDEDWIHGPVARYVYFPPAVVSQLLWNLRHPLFAEEDDDDAAAATPVAAFSSSSPLRRSARLSSTPARRRSQRQQQPPSSPLQYARPPPSTMPAPPRPVRLSAAAAARKHHTQQGLVRPSQATTASQASTVVASSPLSSPAARAAAAVRGVDGSSESLVFDDHGGSSIPMPYSGVSGLDHLEASQLLTVSQILPESLVRDEEQEQGQGQGQQRRVPDEIVDSEEDE